MNSARSGVLQVLIWSPNILSNPSGNTQQTLLPMHCKLRSPAIKNVWKGHSNPLHKNSDYKQTKNLLPRKQPRGIWKKDAQETQAEMNAPDLFLLTIPTLLLVPSFWSNLSPFVPNVPTELLSTNRKKKKKKGTSTYQHLSSACEGCPLCWWW